MLKENKGALGWPSGSKANLFMKNLGIEDFERHTRGMFLSCLKQEGCWNMVFQDMRKGIWQTEKWDTNTLWMDTRKLER